MTPLYACTKGTTQAATSSIAEAQTGLVVGVDIVVAVNVGVVSVFRGLMCVSRRQVHEVEPPMTCIVPQVQAGFDS